MRFGLFGGPVRTGSGVGADLRAYEEYVANVKEAEALGFYGTYLVEHHFTGHGQVSSSLQLLSFLAAQTSTIRLGTAVVVLPWHNPALLAEQVATVDLLSNGRLDLGIGRGYRDLEFMRFGIPRAEAQSRFRDAVRFLHEAWSHDGRFSFAGEHWSFEDILIEPEPVQRPHPPLWVGAASERSIVEAAHAGYRLLLDQVGTFEQVGQRVATYRAATGDVGAEGQDIALTRPLLLARDATEREALLTSHLSTLERLAQGSAPSSNPFYSDPATRRETAEAGAIVGTPDECIERLRHLRSLGVRQVLFTRTNPETLRLFSREVMPAFA